MYLSYFLTCHFTYHCTLILAVMLIDSCLLLLVYYLGLALTLAEATPVPVGVWAGVIFVCGIYFVRRKTLDATVISALVVGAINLGLILMLSTLALRHLRVEHLLYVHIPFINGSPFEPVMLGLIFGIVLSAYDGHLSVSSCARTMLRRDPGGRSLIWGAIAAEASAMVVYILWVIAVNGAFAPQALAGLSGTVVAPLAQLLGPVAILCGTILAILAMGMGSIFISLAIFFMVQEWIPGRTRHTLALGRRQGKVIFTPRDKASIGLTLTYLSLKRTQELMQGAYSRFWLGLIPLILIFLTTEWLLLKKLESFSQMLDFLGIVALPLEIGVFPVILLYASRRKGEYVPSFVPRFLAHPAVVGIIYLVSVGFLFLHGLFIWQNTLQRAIAILVGVIILVVTYMMIRQGAFARRLVIELRQASAKEGGDTFTVTDSGRAATQVRVRLGYAELEHVYQIASGSIPEFPDLRSAKFHLYGIKAQELRVWPHRVTAEGQSVNLPAHVKVSSERGIQEYYVDGTENKFVLPLHDAMKKRRKGGPAEINQLAVEVQLADYRA